MTTPNHTRQNMKFAIEQNIVCSLLLEKYNFSECDLSNPNEGRSKDSGADVLFLYRGRKIGFQVTEFHNDEEIMTSKSPQNHGSGLRAQEAKNFRSETMAWYQIASDPIASLKCRILDKVNKSKQYTFDLFDEVILLVAASIPRVDGVAGTMLPDNFSDRFIEKLDQEISPILEQGKYSRLFIYKIMGFPSSAVYEWRRQSGWKKLNLEHLSFQDFFYVGDIT